MKAVAFIRAGLDWLEEQLKLRHTTAGCLFIAAVALPFVLVLLATDVYAVFVPAAGRYYHPVILRIVTIKEAVSLLVYLGVVVWCLPRYRSSQERPWLAYGLITYVLVASTTLALLFGHKDTPMPLVFMASFVLTRAWFPLRMLMPGLLISAILVGLAELLIAQGVMPYAPLLTEPMVTGRPMAWWWMVWVRLIFDMSAVFFAAAMFFIFALMERRHRELEELTRLDTLTGLPNRASFMRLFEEEFGKQLRSRRAACVMMIDVDHFKRVNDTYGHAAGDMVLAELGQLLGDAVRQPIDVPARFGGEEFVVLLPESGLESARRVAERIRARLAAREFLSEGRRFRVTLSIGIAEADDGNADRALRIADANLYRAKAEGRDRVVGSLAAVAG